MVSGAYGAQGRIFMAQAWEELEKGDLRQASEKGWGAASQTVKALADARGWEHETHRRLFGVVRRMVDEMDDYSLPALFSGARLLHVNFYEDGLSPGRIAYHLPHVSEFVDRAESLVEAR